MMIGYIFAGTISMVIGFFLIKNPNFLHKLALKINPGYLPTKGFKEFTETSPYYYIMKGVGYLILIIGLALIVFGLLGFDISNIIPKKTN